MLSPMYDDAGLEAAPRLPCLADVALKARDAHCLLFLLPACEAHQWCRLCLAILELHCVEKLTASCALALSACVGLRVPGAVAFSDTSIANERRVFAGIQMGLYIYTRKLPASLHRLTPLARADCNHVLHAISAHTGSRLDTTAAQQLLALFALSTAANSCALDRRLASETSRPCSLQ